MDVAKSLCHVSPYVYGTVFGGLTLGTLIWEHIGRKKEERLREQKADEIISKWPAENQRVIDSVHDSEELKQFDQRRNEDFQKRLNLIVVNRPSIGLTKLSNKSQQLFEWCGRNLAWLSSYLTQIDLKEVTKTVFPVVKPICTMVVSPVYFIYGYFKAAAEYLGKEWLIYLGSALVVVMLGVGWYQFSDYLPTLPYLSSVGTLCSSLRGKFLTNA